MRAFYGLYESLFGAKNCTYTVHIVASHLLDMRVHGPLTETSAFNFESFYAELRRSFVPGTPDPLKQILQKVMMKRHLSLHTCSLPIHYSQKDTPLESNSMIYIYYNNEHQFFKICEITSSGTLILRETRKVSRNFSGTNFAMGISRSVQKGTNY